ncbi:MAG: phenylacetate--CoA ligase family protein, partial [Nitrospirota bacterium]
MQKEEFQKLCGFVQENVPYYKGLLDSNSNISEIPFLTKKIIIKNIKNMCSKKAHGLVRSSTGGSTGEPLTFYLGKRRISADIAGKLRAARWWGVDIGDPEIVIWGSPVELTRQDKIRNLRDWLFRTKLLSAFNMSEETMLRYLNIIKSYRPKHVFGYPSSIFLLCRYARQKNIRLDNLGTKVVFCTAEKLYDHQREMISETFSAPVANGYGGRDSGFIAHECPRGGMHIAAENIVVEIVDHEGNSLPSGCRGEIVITHLDSHDFPFIRYKTGDIGSLSEDVCPCGRGLPLLKDIEGRTTDFIITSDKKIMHGLSLIYILREINGIEEFRIVQEEVDLFSVSIVKNSSFGSESEEVIRKGFKDRIGSDVKIRFNYQQKIEPEKSGKFRYVVS